MKLGSRLSLALIVAAMLSALSPIATAQWGGGWSSYNNCNQGGSYGGGWGGGWGGGSCGGWGGGSNWCNWNNYCPPNPCQPNPCQPCPPSNPPCPPTTVEVLGDSCGNPTPNLAITAAGLGETAYICLDSEFPGDPLTMEGHAIIFASFPPALPYPVFPPTTPGFGDCTVYVDLANLRFVEQLTLDADGDICIPFPILNDPLLVGQTVNLQARVWSLGGPFEGGDHLSNGLQMTFGCDGLEGEGKTPGYWKQCQHFHNWAGGYTPSTLFSDVFDNAFPGKTLLQVLQQGGGGLNALGRHTVAALLNSVASNVDYALTAEEVITLFNGNVPGPAAGIENLKNYFQSLNELGN